VPVEVQAVCPTGVTAVPGGAEAGEVEVLQADAAPESGQGWRPDGTARLGSTRFAVWTVQSLDDSQIAISE